MAAEVPLELSNHLALPIKTLAGEKEMQDLNAIMSCVPQLADQYASKTGAMRDGTLVLAQLLLTTCPVSERRAVAIAKLMEFFLAAQRACTFVS